MRKRFANITSSLRLAKCAVALLVSMGVFFAGSPFVHAQKVDAPEKPKSGMALPGEKCRVAPLKGWTEPERWAWKEICEGRFANFNGQRRAKKLNPENPKRERLDPRNPKDDNKWADNRKLSSAFLETILLQEPFRSTIPHRGVRIRGAYFKDKIDLSDASIERLLALHHSLFKSPVIMRRFTTTRSISFVGSKFEDTLNMDSASVGGSLFMWNAQFKDVDLRGLKVGAQLSMNGSTFAGKLTCGSAMVGSSLHMRNAQFNVVDLRGSKVGAQLSMNGSTFTGKLNMDSAAIGGDHFMQNARFKEVHLRGLKVGDQLAIHSSEFKGKLTMDAASIGGSLHMRNSEFKEALLLGLKVGKQLSMIGSTFEGKLTMDDASIGGSLLMRNAKFKEARLAGLKVGNQLSMIGSKFGDTLNMGSASIKGSLLLRNANLDKSARLTFLSVGSILDARGATLRGLDLSGTQIEGELLFGLGEGAKKTEWKGTSPKIKLRNASVGALQDTEDSWPDNLEREFEGFIYQRLGGLGMNEKKTPYQRSSEWFVDWLAKDKTYSPQPYLHLAKVLRAAGHEEKADDILYENRERELHDPKTSPRRKWALSVLRETIGYGYGLGYFQALRWVLGMVLLGAFFLRINEESYLRKTQSENRMERLGLWYSLDMLLPVIRLRQEHYEVDLETQWVRIYFYIHKIIGYVLIFFVISGLTGLTE